MTRPRLGRALIKVGYACNNSCVFCHSAGSEPWEASADRVEAKIRRAADLDCAMVVLSGGEPTMRRALPRWARQARSKGLGFGLITNGRMLGYPRLTEELLGTGLGYAQVSLHGGDAALHDGITRAESFDQTVAAVENLHGAGVELTVNVVVIRANMDRLRGIVDLLGRFRGLRLKFAMVEPKGAALERFEELVPPLDEAAARIGDALVYAREAAPELRLAHEGVPLCLISPPEELSGDLGDLTGGLKEEGFTLMSEANERDFFPVDSENRTFAPCCEGCLLRGRCPGLYRRYLERRGASSLQPRVRE